MLPDIAGSYEETPTNLVDHLARDRRWCQGNLQHLKVLRMPGLRLASQIHLGAGIATTSPPRCSSPSCRSPPASRAGITPRQRRRCSPSC